MSDNFFVNMIKNIDEAGETDNIYGIFVAVGYFVPVWCWMWIIASNVAKGWPNGFIGWLIFAQWIVFPVGGAFLVVSQSLMWGRKETNRRNRKISPCRFCSGHGYLPKMAK